MSIWRWWESDDPLIVVFVKCKRIAIEERHVRHLKAKAMVLKALQG